MSLCGHPPSHLKKRCSGCQGVAIKLRGNFCAFCSAKDTLEVFCTQCSEPPRKCSHSPEQFGRKCTDCEEEMPLISKCCTDCGKAANSVVFCSLCIEATSTTSETENPATACTSLESEDKTSLTIPADKLDTSAEKQAETSTILDSEDKQLTETTAAEKQADASTTLDSEDEQLTETTAAEKQADASTSLDSEDKQLTETTAAEKQADASALLQSDTFAFSQFDASSALQDASSVAKTSRSRKNVSPAKQSNEKSDSQSKSNTKQKKWHVDEKLNSESQSEGRTSFKLRFRCAISKQLTDFNPVEDKLMLAISVTKGPDVGKGFVGKQPNKKVSSDTEKDFYIYHFSASVGMDRNSKKLSYHYEILKKTGAVREDKDRAIEVCCTTDNPIQLQLDRIVEIFDRKPRDYRSLYEKISLENVILSELGDKELPVGTILCQSMQQLKSPKKSQKESATNVIRVILASPEKFGFNAGIDKSWNEWHDNLRLIKFVCDLGVGAFDEGFTGTDELLRMSLPPLTPDNYTTLNPDEEKGLANAIANTIEDALKKENVATKGHALHLVPAYHLLVLKVPPFGEKLLAEHFKWDESKPDMWCGLEKSSTWPIRKQVLQKFKNSITFQSLLDLFNQFNSVDPLLSRFCAGTTAHSDLEDFIKVERAPLSSRLFACQRICSESSAPLTNEAYQQIEKILNDTQSLVGTLSIMELDDVLSICYSLTKKLLQIHISNEALQIEKLRFTSLSVYLHCILHTSRRSDQKNKFEDLLKTLVRSFEKVRTLVPSDEEMFETDLDAIFVQCYNQLYTVLSSASECAEFVNICNETLKKFLAKTSQEIIMDFFKSSGIVTMVSPDMTGIILEVLLQKMQASDPRRTVSWTRHLGNFVDSIGYYMNLGYSGSGHSQQVCDALSGVIDSMENKFIRAPNCPVDITKHTMMLLEWPIAQHLLRMLDGSSSSAITKIDDKAQATLKKCREGASGLLRKLAKDPLAELTIEGVEYLDKHTDSLQEIQSLLKLDVNAEEKIATAKTWVVSFKETATKMDKLNSLFLKTLNTGSSNWENFKEQLNPGKYRKLTIKCLIDEKHPAYALQLKHFAEMQQFKRELETIIFPKAEELLKSATFETIISGIVKCQFKQNNDNKLQITGLVQCLLQAIQQWETKINALKSEDAKWEDTEFLGNLLKDKNKLTTELSCFSPTREDWIDQLAEKLTNAHKMTQFSLVAESILTVLEKLQIRCDVENLERARKVSDEIQDTSLSKMGIADLTEFEYLQEFIESAQFESLMRAIAGSSDLICWLPQNIRSGPQLKTFQDLAMIYLGDAGDLEQKQVEMFVQVVEDFHEVIYNTRELVAADRMSVVDFLGLCKPVLDRVKEKPEKINHLTQTSNRLKWIKIIKENQGSVERPTLKKMEDVFQSGSLQIGCLVRNKDYFLLTTERNRHDKDTTEAQHISTDFTLADMKDLQSKLMLIAGNAYENRKLFDKFVKLTDGIFRLVNVYKDFLTHCCLLCEQIDIRVNVGGSDNQTWQSDDNMRIELRYCNPHKLIACRYVDINDGLTKLSNVLQSCLDKWKGLIAAARTKPELYEINFFTMEQVKLLQSELAIFFVSAAPSKVSDRVLHLLSYICPDCSDDKISQAVDEVVIRKVKGSYCEMDQNESLYTRAIEVLRNEGYSDNVINKTVKIFFRYFEVDNSETWHEKIIELAAEVEKTSIKQLDETYRKDWNTADQELSAADVGDVPAHEAFEKLWKIYEKNVDVSHQDFLSFSDLALFLRCLSENPGCPRTNRKMRTEFSETFPAGKPVAHCINYNDYLLAMLNLFRLAYNCLPQMEEVLMCSDQTTEEEVSVFLHRSVLDESSEALYVVIGIDKLPFNVSVSAEELLSQLLNIAHGQTKARLFILMSDEDQRHSPLCNSLASFVQDMLPLPNSIEIRNWVATFLKEEAPEHSHFVWVTSSLQRSGMGKSLTCHQIAKRASPDKGAAVFSCSSTHLDANELYTFLSNRQLHGFTVFHLDIAREVQTGFDGCMTQLALLGGVATADGYVWRRTCKRSLILLEHSMNLHYKAVLRVLDFLPSIECKTPREILEAINNGVEQKAWEPLLTEKLLQDESIQRPARCLSGESGSSQRQILAATQVLQLLIDHCGVTNPSWQELLIFAKFFNRQMADMEKSIFCSDEAGPELRGFRKFVQKFMLLMSKDFSTRSLNISDESAGQREPEAGGADDDDPLIRSLQIRRTWEQDSHPYLLFNEDGITFTFVGFTVNARGDLLDSNTREVIEAGIMTVELYRGLTRQHDKMLSENIDSLGRLEKIAKMRTVFGLETPSDFADPDPSYELTMDNVKKMLAIYMRFRCEIPVVLMGETGCGKTKLVEFLARLMLPAGEKSVNNFVVLKVHGGVTEATVVARLRDAEKLAASQSKSTKKSPYTIVFFDEVNTTSAIGLVKEIMVDGRAQGEPVDFSNGLRCVAACNPYRKHSEETIKRLETSGLGYRVRKEDTADKFGTVPMRQLVYRVKPLPHSLLQVLWDFGNLSDETEKKYIERMILSRMQRASESEVSDQLKVLIEAVSESQKFMRHSSDEAKFVSLRDVEKVITTFEWFSRNLMMDENVQKEVKKIGFGEFEANTVVTLAVCYLSRLPRDRKPEYLQIISRKVFQNPATPSDIADFISAVQSALIDDVELPTTIAKNEALRENIFMMVVCVTLRIPLFIVGKPGSSKSLGKAIVKEVMQGPNSQGRFFKKLPNTQMLSFQCSPWSTPEGVINLFIQSAKLQRGKNPNEFVSVVILDEIGLAEDSHNMPLKALHSLLEDGVTVDPHQGDTKDSQNDAASEKPEEGPHVSRVAFVGLSNWALDPAKMNRGLYIIRDAPTKDDLIETAKGICKERKLDIVSCLDNVTRYYFRICEVTSADTEFFGLRDYFSLVKHLVLKSKGEGISNRVLAECLMRNFSGFRDLHPVELFANEFGSLQCELEGFSPIIDSLQPVDDDQRYLLLIAENVSGLKTLLRVLKEHKTTVSILYGSSFPKDQEYSKVCMDINKIKISMERGDAIVLLNMDILYESLYDALNQYYEYCGQDRFVDLGLGTHRLKCKVHKEFKIIVIADQRTVEEKFPIPLINRLEKHKLSPEALATQRHQLMIKELLQWAQEFLPSHESCYSLNDVFVGYHSDVIPALVLDFEDVEKVKTSLLAVATTESLVRLNQTPMKNRRTELLELHWNDLDLLSLMGFLKKYEFEKPLLQVTTFDRLLSSQEVQELSSGFGSKLGDVCHSHLSEFESEAQFSEYMRNFFAIEEQKTLLLQCEGISVNYQNLLSCVKYLLEESLRAKLREQTGCNCRVMLIISLVRSHPNTFTGLESDIWYSVHVEELFPSRKINIRLVDGLSMSDTVLQSQTTANTNDPRRKSEDYAVLDSPLNFNLLLSQCLYHSLSLLRDSVNRDARLGKRRHFLQQALLDGEFQQRANFAIGEALKWKEQAWRAMYAKHEWLSFVPTKLMSVRKAGTLTESTWRTIKQEVAPAFACFVALVDRDGNLQNFSAELKQLWLDLFDAAFLWDSEYKKKCEELMRATADDTLLECHIDLTSSATDKHEFVSQFPFSWTILHCIENILRAHGREKLMELFRVSEFGQRLQRYKLSAEMLNRFCHDMLHVMFADADDEAVTQLCPVLELSCNPEISNTSLPDAMIGSFLVLHEHRLQTELALKLRKKVEGLHLDTRSVQHLRDLPHAIFCSYCQYFEKNKVDLNRADKRKYWQNRVTDSEAQICRLLFKYGNEKMQLQWDRIHCVFLFLTEVTEPFDCSKSIHESDIKPIQLWNALVRNADESFQCLRALQLVEQFVEKMSRSLTEKILGSPNCGQCQNRSDYKLILPCADRLCEKCVSDCEIAADNESQRICPICKESFDPTAVTGPKQQVLVDFKTRCNRFMMQVVSKLCFRPGRPPSEELCHHLFSYVTRVTPGANIAFRLFGDDKDDSPVFRSFILQQLLRFQPDQVVSQLQQHVNAAAEGKERRELAMIVVYCMEDAQFARIGAQSDKERLQQAVASLQIEQQEVPDALLQIPYLQWVAARRAALRVLATAMSGEPPMPLNDEELEELASALESHDWSKIFFLRCLCMELGIYKALGRISDHTSLAAVFDSEIKQKLSTLMPDFLISHSEFYREIRKHITLALNQPDLQAISISDTDSKIFALAALTAVYRFKHVADEDKSRLENLSKFLDSQMPSEPKKLYQKLTNLTKEEMPDHNVALLRIHLAFALQSQPTGSCAFRDFLSQLHTASDSWFLPAMPHDELWERVMEMKNDPIVTEQRGVTLSDRQLKMYCCRNGHPYVLGECTQGWVTYDCPVSDCAEKIGGKNHQLAEGNTEYHCKTSRGYVPVSEDQEQLPLRKLTPASAAMVRLLQTLSLLVEAKDPGLLLQRLHGDLRMFCRVTGRSEEDAYHSMHLLIAQLENSNSKPVEYDLDSDNGRRIFETRLNSELVEPIVCRLNHQLQESNQLIAKDSKGVAQFVYGTSEMDQEEEATMWRCNRRITIEHAEHSLQELSAEHSERCRLSRTVLQWQQVLRYVGSLPLIMHQVGELVSAWSYNLSSKDAQETLLLDICDRSSDCEQSVREFMRIWNLLRCRLKVAHFENSKLPVTTTDVVAEKLPVAALLPHTGHWGRCVVSLVQLLVEAQNAIIDASGVTADETSLEDLDQAVVMSCEPATDILPVLLANCTYSLTDTARIDYDFESLERQLRELLVHGRCRIRPMLPQMVFKNEFHLLQLFERLQRAVPQNLTPNSPMLIQALSTDLPQELPILTEMLDDALPAVVRFLITLAPRKTDEPLHRFMTDTLHMPGLPTPMLQCHASLSDTRLLWMSLDHLRCQKLARSDVNPFEGEDNLVLPEELPVDLKNKRSILMEKLHAFIKLEWPSNRSQYEGWELSGFGENSEDYEDFDIFSNSFKCEHATGVWMALFKMV